MTTRGLAALAVLAAVMVPSRLLRATPNLCAFRRLTGRPCPACGLTRSWNATARLELGRALRLHPMGPLSLLGAIALTVAPAGALESRLARSPGALIGIATAWLTAWTIRLARPARP